MKLVVLGSGTSVPHPKRSSSAFWVETSGGSILLDCSPSAPFRLAQENLDWADLDAIWISHFHIDHCGGLGAFLFGTKYAPQTQTRRKPLRIFGPVGLKGLFERMDGVNNYGLLEQPFPVEIVEVEPLEKFEILSGIDAAALKSPHTDESLALYLRDGETTLVFSADTGPSLPLAAFANQVDLFILECSFVKSKPVEKHLELAEAIYLIRKAKPKRAMLTHFYPEWDDVDFNEELKRFEPLCEVIEAVDGSIVEL
ncbi:MAG: ribonuclease Z [Pyrinomonadaceae bacterium]|nr:ribonuclease Z [Acidobacteriota bacterium]MBK7933269.1 ribonuclease Z [Acidobacteriota bacterium]MBP7374883.1 ribonuclease Z [Pyrinomonadaceae bacterium]